MNRAIAVVIILFITSSLISCKNRISEEKKKAIREKIAQNLVFVEGGTFMMGDAGAEFTDENGEKFFSYWTADRDTQPAHKVTLDSYSILKFEVTYGDFDLFCKSTRREILEERALKEKRRGPSYPIWGCTWQDAKEYCLWLGEVTGLPIDLPTEAQWEFAARSRGLNVGYATDNGKLDPGRNYRGKNSPWHPEPPGTYPPNPLGLYDMSGNVFEWVNDWYVSNYYEKSPELNPQGPEKGTLKIMRGFDVLGSTEFNILYRRAERKPESKDGAGIRCVVNLPEPATEK